MGIRKKIITGAMIVAIGVASVTSVNAKNTNDKVVDINAEICTSTEFDSQFTFKEFSKQFKSNISKANEKKAKELFDKANKYSKDASKYYEELYKLDLYDETSFSDNINVVIDEEAINVETTPLTAETISVNLEINFEDYARDFKKDIKKEVKQKAELLFNKAMKLEKQNKFEEALKVWDEFYKLDLYNEINIAYTDEKFENEFIDEIGTHGTDIYATTIIEDNITELDSEFGQVSDITEEDLYSFEEFAKYFKKGVKADVIKKAEVLFEKAMELEKKATKLWNELYSMDIYSIDYTTIDIK